MKHLDHISHAALSSRHTFNSSYLLAGDIIEAGIPGDFVECGVFGGAQCAAMAKAIEAASDELWHRNAEGRRVHLFDSFEGIPASGPHDVNWTHEAGQSACSLEAVQSMMKQWGIDESLLVYHPGWFADTIPPKEGGGIGGAWWRGQFPKQIAILRLDCDLYESTRICLEHLYPLVSPGGWVIVDDFALPGCRKAVNEYMQGCYPPVYWQKV